MLKHWHTSVRTNVGLQLHHLYTMWADVLKEDIFRKWRLSTPWRKEWICEGLSMRSKCLNSSLRFRNTWQIDLRDTEERHTVRTRTQLQNKLETRGRVFRVCFSGLSVFSRGSLQGEKSVWERWLQAWIRPPPDHVWGAWGNHPAQQQLTHKQTDHSTPGLSHLPASHVEKRGPPCPAQFHV